MSKVKNNGYVKGYAVKTVNFEINISKRYNFVYSLAFSVLLSLRNRLALKCGFGTLYMVFFGFTCCSAWMLWLCFRRFLDPNFPKWEDSSKITPRWLHTKVQTVPIINSTAILSFPRFTLNQCKRASNARHKLRTSGLWLAGWTEAYLLLQATWTHEHWCPIIAVCIIDVHMRPWTRGNGPIYTQSSLQRLNHLLPASNPSHIIFVSGAELWKELWFHSPGYLLISSGCWKSIFVKMIELPLVFSFTPCVLCW